MTDDNSNGTAAADFAMTDDRRVGIVSTVLPRPGQLKDIFVFPLQG